MNNIKFDLLNNKNKRELMMIEERLDVLDKVKEVVFIKGTKYMTTKMVSDYYEVTESTINSVIGIHREELTKNGMKKFTNKELKSLNIQDEYFKIPNTGMILFNKRSILNVSTLLEDSPIAEKVRTLLLDNHEQLINVSDVLENEDEITEEDINESDHEKIENREFYVYVHIRLDNNTVFYVGKGKGKRAYKLSRGEGTHHDNICKACGCKVVIIANDLTEKEAFKLEIKTIKYYVHTLGYGINIEGYKDYDHKLPHLTNCTWGGEGTSGFKFSEESKRKKSDSMKGKMVGEKHPMWGKNPYANKTEEEMEEIRKKQSEAVSGEKNGMFGKKGKDSPIYGEKNGMWGKNPYANKTEEEMEEIRKKMSESHKGKTAGEKNGMFGKPASNRIKIMCITTGETFDCIKDAEKHYSCSHISECCKGRLKHAGRLNGVRLQWKYSEEDDDNESKAV